MPVSAADRAVFKIERIRVILPRRAENGDVRRRKRMQTSRQLDRRYLFVARNTGGTEKPCRFKIELFVSARFECAVVECQCRFAQDIPNIGSIGISDNRLAVIRHLEEKRRVCRFPYQVFFRFGKERMME